jgi:hypothetical protein
MKWDAPAVAVLLLGGVVVLPAEETAPVTRLPPRVERIVLHTLGGPFYGQPEMRWVFFTPSETFARWKRPSFGAHWIVWTDGTIWPRHPAFAASPCYGPPKGLALTRDLAERLVREAAPVYSHVAGHNSRTVGIEASHSGRAIDPFPEPQVRSVAWLVRALLELSQGRLTPRDVVGHKDLDRQPAYVGDRCPAAACLAYVDGEGRPYRRRVDPPEALFAALRPFGVEVPRDPVLGDAELQRALAIAPNEVPRTERP